MMWRCSCRRLLLAHVPYRTACVRQPSLVTPLLSVPLPYRPYSTHTTFINNTCGALLHARRGIATSNDTSEQKEGDTTQANDEENIEEEDSELPGGEAADDGTHHVPSIRTAAPPSAYDLPETTFLKCLEKEMMDEKLRLDKEPHPPIPPKGWQMHHAEGTSLIYGRRLWLPSSSRTTNNSNSGSNKAEEEASKNASQLDTNKGAADESEQNVMSLLPHGGLERHFIRVQLTCRDASLDPECDIRGEHFPFSLFVQRVRQDELAEEDRAALLAEPREAGMSEDAYAARMQAALEQDELTFLHDSVEVRCDVMEGELTVKNVVFHGGYVVPKIPNTTDKNGVDGSTTTNDTTATSNETQRVLYDDPFGSSYPGPNLDDAEEEILDGIQSWLAERMIDDQFGEFVAQYSVWTEQAEYERWLKELYDYVAA